MAMTAVCQAFGQMVALGPRLIGKLHYAVVLVASSVDASPGGRESALWELRAWARWHPALILPPWWWGAGVDLLSFACAPQVRIICLWPVMFL